MKRLTHEEYLALEDREWEEWTPYNVNDPRALVNIVPKRLRRCIEQVPKDYYAMEEPQLEAVANPTVVDKRIRMAFWHEYESAQSLMRDMRVANISMLANVHEALLYRGFGRLEKMAYYLSPPVEYSMFLEEASTHGLQRLRDEILTIDIYKVDPKTGEKVLNTQAANLLLKAIAFVDLRKHGGIVQKNLHIHSDSREMKDVSGTVKTVEDLDKRIKELESQGVTLDGLVSDG